MRPEVAAETLPLASRATARKVVSAASGASSASDHAPKASVVALPSERPEPSRTSTSLPGAAVPETMRPLTGSSVGAPGTVCRTGWSSASWPMTDSGETREACGRAEVSMKVPSAETVADWVEPSAKVTETRLPGSAWPNTSTRPSAATSCLVTMTSPSSWRFSTESERKVCSALEGAAFSAASACWRPWSIQAAAAGLSAKLPPCPVRPFSRKASVSARRPPSSLSTPESLASTRPTRSAPDRPLAASKPAEFVGTAPAEMSMSRRPKASPRARCAARIAARSAGGRSLVPMSRRATSSVSGFTSRSSTATPEACTPKRGFDSATTPSARSVVSRDFDAALTSSR